MTRAVQVIHEALAERWEVGFVDSVGTTLPVALDATVQVGRAADGRVVEVIVDDVGVPDHAIALIADAFGAAVAEVVRRAVPGRDLELTVTVSTPARLTDLAPAVVGEPGVPRRRDDGRYTAPLEHRDAEVELRLTRGELRLHLPADFGSPGWWVRVSDVETGDLLALGPVRSDRGPAPEAALSFGLDLAPEQLHVAVTDQPLAQVGTRLQRRAQWIDRLLVDAAAVRRLRPRTATRLATRARDLALLIDDVDRRRTAEAVLGRSRRWGFGTMGMMVLVVIAVAGLLWAGRSTGPAPTPVTTTSPVTTTTPVATPTPEVPPGSVGPAVFQFGNDTTIEAALIGRLPNATPGEVVPVTVQVTSVLRWSYGPTPAIDPADTTAVLEEARRVCLGITDLSVQGTPIVLPAEPFTVRLVRRDPDGSSILDQLIVGRFDAASEVQSYTTVKESCRSSQFTASNRFEADTAVTRVEQTLEIPLPGDLPTGWWEVRLESAGDLLRQTGTLRLRVTP